MEFLRYEHFWDENFMRRKFEKKNYENFSEESVSLVLRIFFFEAVPGTKNVCKSNMNDNNGKIGLAMKKTFKM